MPNWHDFYGGKKLSENESRVSLILLCSCGGTLRRDYWIKSLKWEFSVENPNQQLIPFYNSYSLLFYPAFFLSLFSLERPRRTPAALIQCSHWNEWGAWGFVLLSYCWCSGAISYCANQMCSERSSIPPNKLPKERYIPVVCTQMFDFSLSCFRNISHACSFSF